VTEGDLIEHGFGDLLESYKKLEKKRKRTDDDKGPEKKKAKSVLINTTSEYGDRVVDSIAGAKKVEDIIYYFCSIRDEKEKTILVASSVLTEKCPSILIQFLEARLKFRK